jgi:nucleotide-binding universal stress UspA family protein
MRFLYLITNQQIDEHVMHYAIRVVEKMEANLDILIIAKNQEQEQNVLNDLDRIKSDLERIPVNIASEIGDPVEVMESALEKEDYDLVMMAVPRRRRIIPSQSRFLSNRIIKSCPVPILLMRGVREDFNHILICTGGQEISEPVVYLSSWLASAADLKATLLNVTSAVPSMYTGIGEMDESLETILEGETPLAQHLRRSAKLLEDHQVKAEIKVKHGDVVEAILEEVNTGHYDLVVLGEPSEDTLTRMLVGNITQQIINRAASAVLIVK